MAGEPDWSAAVVSTEKLVDYLLNVEHPEGRSKAVFFRACGFEPTRCDQLVAALQTQASTANVTSVQGQFGVKYVADGPITGLDGVLRRVRSVWIVESGEDRPRFVTAYPLEANDGDH